MADFKKYLRAFENARLSEVVCRHCWAQAKSASAVDSVCNFCEQYVGASGYVSVHDPEAEAVFLRLQKALGRGISDDDLVALDALLKTSSDPQVLYVSGIFYSLLSDSLYSRRDYGLSGFMEENSSNIKASLVHSARSKELFYGAIALAGSEPSSGAEAEGLLFMEFLCWIRLKRIADASRVLDRLRKLAKEGKVLNYAEMVFSVESGAKDADARLSKLLSGNEANSFYYLAKHLAKENRFGEALAVLAQLGRKANMQMAAQLANSIKEAQEASSV
jgi:hypothetical protein